MPTNAAGRFEYPEDNWAEGRMRKQGDPSEYQMAGLLDWLLPGYGTRGTEAKPTPEPTRTVNYGAAKPMSAYPTDFDAEEAAQHGIGYGTIHEPYITGKTAKVYGEVRTKVTPATKGTKGKPGTPATSEDRFVAFTPEGQTVSSLLNAVNDRTKSTNLDLTKPEFKEVRDRIGHAYTRAAMAVEANPLAKLGYDPNLVMADVAGVKTNLSGAYRRPKLDAEGKEIPNTEAIYANLTDPSVLVHESIHRGLRKLESNPKAQELMQKLPGGKDDLYEMAVRYMMVRDMGDPEVFGPSGRKDKQREVAISMFDKSQYGKEKVKVIDELMKIAADEVAKKHPGGPR